MRLSELSQKAVALAVQQSLELFAKPVCVSVCDATGMLLAFQRMDGAPLRCINIAVQKAYTAVRMGSSTIAFGLRLQNEGVPASAFCDDKLTPLAGGELILDKEGNVCAGIGISGLKPEEDARLAALIAEAIRAVAQ